MSERDRNESGAGAAPQGPDSGGPGGSSLLSERAGPASFFSPRDPYSFLCAAATLVIGSCFLSKEWTTWSFFPVLLSFFPIVVGLSGVAFGWSIAPFLMILVTSTCMAAAEPDLPRSNRLFITAPDPDFFRAHRAFDFTTWLVCTATLAYVAGHFRLQGLRGGLFPSGFPGGRAPRSTNSSSGPSAGRTVEPNEMGWLILVVAAIVFATIFVLPLLPDRAQDLGITERLWLALVVGWLLALVLLSIRGALAYDRLRSMSVAEARMILQDALWLELGGEQRRLHRWLASARRRKER